jgi:ribosomal protein L40E
VPFPAATTITSTATNGSGLLVVAGLVLAALAVLTVCHLTVCWLRPFTRCRHRNPLRRAALCRRCEGTGYRVRVGRHVLKRLRDAHHRADRLDDH